MYITCLNFAPFMGKNPDLSIAFYINTAFVASQGQGKRKEKFNKA